MRVLLDECLPRRLKAEINGDDVRTVPEIGWAGERNGELLKLAEKEFDVFLTSDRNIEHQQNLKNLNLAVIVLVAASNDIVDLLLLVPAVNEVLGKCEDGEIEYIGRT